VYTNLNVKKNRNVHTYFMIDRKILVKWRSILLTLLNCNVFYLIYKPLLIQNWRRLIGFKIYMNYKTRFIENSRPFCEFCTWQISKESFFSRTNSLAITFAFISIICSHLKKPCPEMFFVSFKRILIIFNWYYNNKYIIKNNI